MNNIEIKRITRKQLWAELEEGLITFTLFGGSRLFFVDEVLAAYKNDVFVGAVSLSPYNEMGFAAPSIIGLLVLEDYRRQGIGRKLMEKAITRMQERHLTPVNIDVLSKNAMNLINTLNPAFKKDLTMNDMSEFDCFDVLAKTKGNVLIF